jgi:hypothetical protein
VVPGAASHDKDLPMQFLKSKLAQLDDRCFHREPDGLYEAQTPVDLVRRIAPSGSGAR